MDTFTERRLDRIRALLDQSNPRIPNLTKSKYLSTEAKRLSPKLDQKVINRYLSKHGLPEL